MVGFVLIVVIVVIVAVILLGLTLRKTPPSKDSKEVENFLEASMMTTTDCAINFAPEYDTLQDLIKSCYENRNCENGNNACTVLNTTLEDMINRAFPTTQGSQYKAYSMQINYKNNESQGSSILELGSNCSDTGAMKTIPEYPGEIEVDMNLCFSQS